MAFTRKFLSALGIETDKVDEIIAAHTEVTDALKTERDKYRQDAEKLPGVLAELDGLKAEAAKYDGKNPFEVKYNAIKEEFEAYKTEQATKESKAAKEKAYREMLKTAGISEKRLDSVMRVSDIDGIELDKDGTIKGVDDLVKSVREEWSDFIPTKETEGANTANPPANTGGGTMSKEDILKIKNTSERQKAIAENIDLFKKGTK